ncbi:MAG: hypothetical protein Q4F34_05410, partial [Prevotellaceae bacterium]|nr:hypothetical protein [Prevotellaceae bacterium]
MNSDAQTMTLVSASSSTLVEVGTPDATYTYALDLQPGKYILTGLGADNAVRGTMELDITDEPNQECLVFDITSIKATNKNWVCDEDYTIESVKCRTREGKIIPVTLGNGKTAGTKSCLVLNGCSFNCTFHPSAAHQAEGYLDAYGSATVTANTTSSAAIAMGGDFVIEFPADANCMVFRKEGGTNGSGSVHFVPFVPIQSVDSVAGKVTYKLAEGNTYNYRLWKKGKRTKAGMFVYYHGSSFDGKVWSTDGDGFNHLTFTDADLAEDPKYINHNTADGKGGNVANILLNINERGHLSMQVGETKDLLAQRDWQLTNSQTANYFIEPSYHYTVFDLQGNPGSDVITIENADTEINPWAKLTAKKKGEAIVLVSYDAINVTQIARKGSGTEAKPYYMEASDFMFLADWSALWGENTGVFVVTVGEETSSLTPNMLINEDYNLPVFNEKTQKYDYYKVAGEFVDAEHDCFYYLKGEDGFPYTFTPADVAKVEIAYPTIDSISAKYSGFVPVEANTNGSYTLNLKHGRQIVRLTGTDGNVIYQVFTAKECNRTITNTTHDDGLFYAGDAIEIQYDGLYHPANKLAGIYNMSAYVTYNGVPTGTALILGKNQYAFGGTPSAQLVKVTIPEDWDASQPFVMDKGTIQVTGFGDPIGNHRIIDPGAGRCPNFTALSHQTYFGILPEVRIEISNVPTGITTVQPQNPTTVQPLYNIQGVAVNENYRGLVI